MDEIKKIKILPEEEASVIKERADFGWSYVSSQEINNSESHLERRGDALYSVTTKENYVNLVLKRETEMNNYLEIKKLEDEYDNVPADSFPKKGNKMLIVAFVIGIALIGSAVGMLSQELLVGIAQIAGGAVVIFVGILLKKFFMKNYNKALKINEDNRKLKLEIRSKAKNLLSK